MVLGTSLSNKSAVSSRHIGLRDSWLLHRSESVDTTLLIAFFDTVTHILGTIASGHTRSTLCWMCFRVCTAHKDKHKGFWGPHRVSFTFKGDVEMVVDSRFPCTL